MNEIIQILGSNQILIAPILGAFCTLIIEMFKKFGVEVPPRIFALTFTVIFIIGILFFGEKTIANILTQSIAFLGTATVFYEFFIKLFKNKINK